MQTRLVQGGNVKLYNCTRNIGRYWVDEKMVATQMLRAVPTIHCGLLAMMLRAMLTLNPHRKLAMYIYNYNARGTMGV